MHRWTPFTSASFTTPADSAFSLAVCCEDRPWLTPERKMLPESPPGRDQKMLTRIPELTPKDDIWPKWNCGQIWYSKSAARRLTRRVRR